MKIVELDGYAANPGDLSWDGLKQLGELTVYDRTAPQDVLERARGAQVILTNKVLITGELMDQMPELRYIGVLATGYNVVDIPAARRHGIVVTNIPAYSTMSVAQMVMAHLLNITNRVALHSDAVKTGEWQTCHTTDRVGWQNLWHCRPGKYGFGYCTHCTEFRYACAGL